MEVTNLQLLMNLRLSLPSDCNDTNKVEYPQQLRITITPPLDSETRAPSPAISQVQGGFTISPWKRVPQFNVHLNFSSPIG